MSATHPQNDEGFDEALRYTRCAGPGSTVTVVDRHGRTTVYELVEREPDPAPQRATIESPEGITLLGARSGDAITIRMRNGRQRRIRVVNVGASTSARPDPQSTAA